jgi:hypothetical protein
MYLLDGNVYISFNVHIINFFLTIWLLFQFPYKTLFQTFTCYTFYTFHPC